METGKFVLDTLGQIQRSLSGAVDGLTKEELAYQPDKESNPIGFILWHQVRAEDSMVNGMLRQKPELWESDNWCRKLNFPEGTTDSGWGYTVEQIAAFTIPGLEDLMGYANAVRSETENYIISLSPEGFDEVINSPFGEMAVGGVLSMLVCELALHTGQIAYLRGLQRGLNK